MRRHGDLCNPPSNILTFVFEVVIVQIDDLRTKYLVRSAYISMMHWYQGEPNFSDLVAGLKSDAELVDEQYLPKT